ncbi:hypothetical protein D3C83_23820 [compost metagenome]
MAVLELHPESRIGQGLGNLALHLYGFFLGHQRDGNMPPLKFAFLSRLSYWWDIM